MKNLPDDFKQISIHGFRHTHASLLFEAGASIKDVQSRLGHSDIKLQWMYIPTYQKQQKSS